MIDSQPLIQLDHINKYYQVGEQKLHVLKDIQLSIQKGEFVSVMGPSGSGKSTLINIVGFLDNKFEGEYYFDGQAIKNWNDNKFSRLRNEEVGFIFQSFNLIESMSVADNVRLPLIYQGMRTSQTREQVQHALERVGLANKGRNKIYELSGGQKQRVAIARALINRPSFIIADEPTGALDTKTSKVIMEIISELNQKDGVTVMMVTHDPNLQAYADRHIVIIDGVMSEQTEMDAEALTREFNKSYQVTDEFEDRYQKKEDQV
ncbi:ABC transporter ATP-binding protein [Hutsoniella sourekii]